MYRCKYCGAEFDQPHYKREIDGFDENDREVVMQYFSCPFCGDEEIECVSEDDGFDLWFDQMEEERREREELLNEWY